jgi:hypothetical protein
MKHFAKVLPLVDAALNSRGTAGTKSLMSFLTHLRKPSRGLALVMALVLAGCSSGSGSSGSGVDPNGNNSGLCKTGVNARWAMPAGTPFALPTGVTIDGAITADIDPLCIMNHVEEFGGEFVGVCIPLKNTTAGDLTVTLPAGLTFIAATPTTQNGMILQNHDLMLPAGMTTVFFFRLFCLDMNCDFAKATDRFTFGNVTNDPGILELIGLAKDKTLAAESDISGALVYGVWDITDGSGLTPDHRAAIVAAN